MRSRSTTTAPCNDRRLEGAEPVAAHSDRVVLVLSASVARAHSTTDDRSHSDALACSARPQLRLTSVNPASSGRSSGSRSSGHVRISGVHQLLRAPCARSCRCLARLLASRVSSHAPRAARVPRHTRASLRRSSTILPWHRRLSSPRTGGDTSHRSSAAPAATATAAHVLIPSSTPADLAPCLRDHHRSASAASSLAAVRCAPP